MVILVAYDLCLRMCFANGLSLCTLFLVALILKVGKCVLQLVENLAFIVVCIARQFGKCVLQIELKRIAICGLILRVGKCVLQLVENLTYMPWMHFISCANVFCKFDLKGNAKILFSSVVRSDRRHRCGLTGVAGQARGQVFPESDFSGKWPCGQTGVYRAV